MPIYKTKIKSILEIAENTIELVLERPKNFNYQTGQYLQLSLEKMKIKDRGGNSRVLSIATSPKNKTELSLIFRKGISAFKQEILNRKKGDEVKIEGPYGFFNLPKNFSKEVVFVAGGVGIVPYLSILRDLADEKLSQKITLLFANNNQEATVAKKELEKIAQNNEKISVYFKYGRIDKKFIKKIKNKEEVLWHITGPPAMVMSIRQLLLEMEIKEEKIFSESFEGY